MELLRRTENKNFNIIYDCLFNQRLQVKQGEEFKTINFTFGPEEQIDTYPSGALARSTGADYVRVMFVNNDGSILVDAYRHGLDDLGAQVYDIRGYVYTTGVMLDIEYYNHTQEFYYYTYLGTYLKADNFEEMEEKVNKYELSIGAYHNDLTLPKIEKTPYTDFIMGFYNADTNQTDASI